MLFRSKDGLDALIGPTGLPAFLPAGLSGINTGILHGELGYSYANGEGVADMIGHAALPTLILAGLSIAIWLTLAVILGVWTGLKNGSRFDNTVTTLTYVTSTFPTFILGFMLIWVFAVTLGWTPVSGMTDARQFPAFGSDLYWQYFGIDPVAALIDLARHLILPVSTLVIISVDRKSTRLNSSHSQQSRMPSSA